MFQRKRFGFGALVVITAIYFFVYSAVKYNLSVTTAALASQPVTIVLDAGHGGEDGGATSVTGVLESGINLSITLRLEQVLALCGFRISMIRSDDVSVYTEGNTITEKKVSDLKHRVQLVNAQTPAVLISIHQNHFSEAKYDGAQVFYAGTDGSKLLAELTQATLRQTLDPGNRREAKAASSVYLMEKIQCTGILVECGFLSNPEEDQLLQNETYQTKIACAVGSALAQCLEKGDINYEV